MEKLCNIGDYDKFFRGINTYTSAKIFLNISWKLRHKEVKQFAEIHSENQLEKWIWTQWYTITTHTLSHNFISSETQNYRRNVSIHENDRYTIPTEWKRWLVILCSFGLGESFWWCTFLIIPLECLYPEFLYAWFAKCSFKTHNTLKQIWDLFPAKMELTDSESPSCLRRIGK